VPVGKLVTIPVAQLIGAEGALPEALLLDGHGLCPDSRSELVCLSGF
jgi:hypothetical protein